MQVKENFESVRHFETRGFSQFSDQFQKRRFGAVENRVAKRCELQVHLFQINSPLIYVTPNIRCNVNYLSFRL